MSVTEPPGYTLLRVVDAGVVLFDFHRARLGRDAATLAAFDAFSRSAEPGIVAVRGRAPGDLALERRATSRLADGQPTRRRVSPVAHLRGPLPKQPAPSVWDDVRLAGVATLLTSADGEELYESCVACVLAWDGAGFVAPPDDRPRVASTFERWLVETGRARRAPLRLDAGWPLVLANAVAGPCVPEQPQPPPPHAVSRLRDAWLATARRAGNFSPR
jgi:hypothetical protein